MVRILVADDHPDMLRMVHRLLREEDGWEVCGEAVNGEEAVSKALGLKPDVTILDFSMPKLNGLEAARMISEKQPGARMILFTVRAVDERLVDEAQRVGIRAVINKCSANLLVCAVRVLLQGDIGTLFALTRTKRSPHTVNRNRA